MNDEQILTRLLDDLSETLELEGFLPLHDFSWTLRGYQLALTEPEIERLCETAFKRITAKKSFTLATAGWPFEIEDLRPAAPGTSLNFDIGSTGSVPLPLQVLLPPARTRPQT